MFPSFPIPQQKLGDCSSNKLYRQLCMHYEHSSRGIRGCTFEEEALYFEFSKTPELSKTADTIVPLITVKRLYLPLQEAWIGESRSLQPSPPHAQQAVANLPNL